MLCQQIIQFCSGSAKPLIFAGSILTLLLVIAIGYVGYSTKVLYEEIDPSFGYGYSLAYYLQVAAFVNLIAVTLHGCSAAYYDQKHSIRMLSIVTMINFVLVITAIFLVPSREEVTELFSKRLSEFQTHYDFTDKTAFVNSTVSNPDESTMLSSTDNKTEPKKPTKVEATKLWDTLQSKGCCGLRNGTTEWKPDIPKSCCAKPEDSSGKYICKAIDDNHKKPCIDVIQTTGFNLVLVLAIIALVDLYLASVTCTSSFRTFHYDEANQNAYS